jgi:hypothetical protein
MYKCVQNPIYQLDMLNNSLYILYIYLNFMLQFVILTATYAVKLLLMMDKERPKHVKFP